MINEINQEHSPQNKNIFLKIIIFISALWLVFYFAVHFFITDSTYGLNLDMIFFTISVYGFRKKKLEVVKFAFFWLIMALILSIIIYNIFLAYIISAIPIIFIWVGIFILSRLTNQSCFLDKSIFKPFKKLDSNSKKAIGIITAIFALMQFIPYNPHIAILWLAIYIVSILKNLNGIAKLMLLLWALPYAAYLGRAIYRDWSVSLDILTGVIFLVANTILLYMGVYGVSEKL